MKLKLVIGLLAITCSLALAVESPVQVIQKKDKDLQTLIKKSNLSAKEKDRIKTLLSDVFDFSLLAEKSLPTKTWKDLNDESRKTFTSEFQRMVRNSSAKKLEMYRSDSTRYEEPKMKKTDDCRLVSHVWYKGKETVIEYRMNLVNGQWKAWDLIIDDLSTARNYKEQFGKILETKTFAELVEIIRKKADQTE
ncbi:MAG: toluene tolerance protein [Fibrobacteres bacterium CG2_30_45_31]|nr:MAG: toluene tolerance protein [Fibrobacteres bacterium CG2_30_45_31]